MGNIFTNEPLKPQSRRPRRLTHPQQPAPRVPRPVPQYYYQLYPTSQYNVVRIRFTPVFYYPVGCPQLPYNVPYGPMQCVPLIQQANPYQIYDIAPSRGPLPSHPQTPTHIPITSPALFPTSAEFQNRQLQPLVRQKPEPQPSSLIDEEALNRNPSSSPDISEDLLQLQQLDDDECVLVKYQFEEYNSYFQDNGLQGNLSDWHRIAVAADKDAILEVLKVIGDEDTVCGAIDVYVALANDSERIIFDENVEEVVRSRSILMNVQQQLHLDSQKIHMQKTDGRHLELDNNNWWEDDEEECLQYYDDADLEEDYFYEDDAKFEDDDE
jgi:hypothetical protein